MQMLLCFYTKYSYTKTRQSACSATGASVHDQGNDQPGHVSNAIEVCETAMVSPNIPVETQNFGENEDEDHADKDPRLAHERAHALAEVSHSPCRTA